MQKLEITQSQLTVMTDRYKNVESQLNGREQALQARERRVTDQEYRLKNWEDQLRQEAEEI